MFENWLVGVNKKNKKLIFAGASSVLFRATYWIWGWTQLQRYDDNIKLKNDVCRKLELTIMHLFTNFEW
uniref:Uncharacterized protein n=1 Tax=Oryza meridionalis TaxID=40149 RepID=A0A0E0E2D1_9ORYZ